MCKAYVESSDLSKRDLVRAPSSLSPVPKEKLPTRKFKLFATLLCEFALAIMC